MRASLLLLLMISGIVFSQDYQAKTFDFENMDLHPPMKIPLILAGNFGEMRSNHFHTGLDIKTKGVEGQKLYSIEEGYISRLRVSPWGYGLAVYIEHTNGLTSLYGHMSKFSPLIDSLIYAAQKKNESYIIDEVVLNAKIKVEKGEYIGLSGNSGSSSAAHLHFELRETATEHALNPLLFKCYRKRIRDSTKPTIKGIKVYAVTKKGYLIPGKSKYYYCKYVNGKYIVNNGKPIDVSSLATENSYLACGFHVVDRLDGAGNICGVHHTYLNKEETTLHEQQIDYVNFDNNRFINSHQDYFEYKQNKRNIHKNFKTVVNPLGIYPQANGLIEWSKCAGDYTYKAIDVHGNAVDFNFSISNPEKQKAKNPYDNNDSYYYPDSVNTLIYDGFQVLMEPGTFYEPIEKIFKIDSTSIYISPKFLFSEYAIPVQKNFDIRIKTPPLPEGYPISKLGIGLISDKGYLSFKGGDYINGWVESSSRNFGTFVLMVDSIPPKITPLDFTNKKIISRYRTLELTIEDNLAGIWKYKAYINENWVLMYYHKKKKKYVIPLDKRSKPNLKQGENKVRIYARDGKGNVSESVYTVIY